ncbi:MAG TPA: hypothetical protein VGL98_11330 [Gammaproteobacteria bacterium]
MRPHLGVCAVLVFAIAGFALAPAGIVRAQPIINVTGDPDAVLERVLQDLDEQLERELGSLEWRKALGPLDGTWEGSLAVIAATDNVPAQFWQIGDHPELQIVAERGTAVVRVKTDDWRAVNVAGGFHVADLMGGGFIYAGQSANGWVENWNLTVAKQDPDTLRVFLSFVAGRSLDRLDAGNAAFAVGAMGELKRRTE